MKTCTKCKNKQPLNQFYSDKSRPDGKHSICKACHKTTYIKYRTDPTVVERQKKRSKLWRENNPERSKRAVRCATLRKKYGISADEYDKLLTEQGNVCAICGDSDSKGYGQMHIDHNHVTGNIRGILCQACNVTLGKMKDSPELLRKAADYLEKSP